MPPDNPTARRAGRLCALVGLRPEGERLAPGWSTASQCHRTEPLGSLSAPLWPGWLVCVCVCVCCRGTLLLSLLQPPKQPPLGPPNGVFAEQSLQRREARSAGQGEAALSTSLRPPARSLSDTASRPLTALCLPPALSTSCAALMSCLYP